MLAFDIKYKNKIEPDAIKLSGESELKQLKTMISGKYKKYDPNSLFIYHKGKLLEQDDSLKLRKIFNRKKELLVLRDNPVNIQEKSYRFFCSCKQGAIYICDACDEFLCNSCAKKVKHNGHLHKLIKLNDYNNFLKQVLIKNETAIDNRILKDDAYKFMEYWDYDIKNEIKTINNLFENAKKHLEDIKNIEIDYILSFNNSNKYKDLSDKVNDIVDLYADVDLDSDEYDNLMSQKKDIMSKTKVLAKSYDENKVNVVKYAKNLKNIQSFNKTFIKDLMENFNTIKTRYETKIGPETVRLTMDGSEIEKITNKNDGESDNKRNKINNIKVMNTNYSNWDDNYSDHENNKKSSEKKEKNEENNDNEEEPKNEEENHEEENPEEENHEEENHEEENHEENNENPEEENQEEENHENPEENNDEKNQEEENNENQEEENNENKEEENNENDNNAINDNAENNPEPEQQPEDNKVLKSRTTTDGDLTPKNEKKKHQYLMKLKDDKIIIFAIHKQTFREKTFIDKGMFSSYNLEETDVLQLNVKRKLFLLGGQNYNNFFYYDYKTNTVNFASTTLYNHDHGAMVYCPKNNSIYLLGGSGVTFCEICNIENMQSLIWEELAELNEERREFSAMYFKDYVYVFFGMSLVKQYFICSIERINVDKNDKFEIIYTNANISLSCAGCCIYRDLSSSEEKDYILLLGGYDVSKYLDKSLIYDVENQQVRECEIVIPNLDKHKQFIFRKEPSFIEYEPGFQYAFDTGNNVHLLSKDSYELFSEDLDNKQKE